MALTAIEQLQIISGTPSPDATDLFSLVLQVGVENGLQFRINAKDTTGDEAAERYYNKYNNVVNSLFKHNRNTYEGVARLLIVILGSNNITLTQVTNATDAQWESFMDANIDEAIEYFADVTAAERTAYAAL